MGAGSDRWQRRLPGARTPKADRALRGKQREERGERRLEHGKRRLEHRERAWGRKLNQLKMNFSKASQRFFSIACASLPTP